MKTDDNMLLELFVLAYLMNYMGTFVLIKIERIENWISGCDGWKISVTVGLYRDNSMLVVAIESSRFAIEFEEIWLAKVWAWLGLCSKKRFVQVVSTPTARFKIPCIT